MKIIRKDTYIIDYLIHGLFFFVYGFFKYVPAPLGNFLRFIVAKIFIKELKSFRIAEGVTFYYPYRITIKKGVTLNEFVYLSGYGNIFIDENTRIGTGTTIISSDHEFKNLEVPIKDQGIIPGRVKIGKNVLIGANVTILKGVEIGNNAIVAAATLVTRNVPANAIVGGVPVKVLRYRA